MPTLSSSDIKSTLQNVIQQNPGTLRANVAEEAIGYDEPKDFFADLLSHGCISGMVPSLIYYTDTHAFFDKHYDAIDDLRSEYEDNFGQPLTINGDLKNYLAWFAFEETAYQLAGELGIDI